MAKRLLITGIGGSIGCHMLAHFMHNTDWEVVGIDSFRHKGWTDRVRAMFDSHPDWVERTTIITHDLVAPFSEILEKKIGHIDYILALASLSDVEASIHDPVTFIRNNTDLTTNILEYARRAKPESFIQFSTDEVYGPTPDKETVYDEWAPIVPSNPYAASKACQEAIAISYWRTYAVPVVITNTMNNFGEMQQSSKFPVMVQKAIRDGKKITVHGVPGDIGSRSYIHSRNAADAILFILRNLPPHIHEDGKADKPDRYNIAGDRQLDNLELVSLIGDIMGKTPDVELVGHSSTRPGHDKHYGLTRTKLENAGWTPPLSFEESLKNTIEWQTEHPEWIQ
jgi:dTDP-glucose 4,6-dehydratase